MAKRKLSESSTALAALAHLTLGACSRLPIGWAQARGALLGHLLWLLPTSPRKVARLNVGWCLPERSPDDRRRLVRASLVATGKNLSEAGAMWRWPAERLAGLEQEVEGEELLHRAMAEGRGTVLLVPHLGNWEMLNPFLMARYPLVALYRPPRIAQLEQTIRQGREGTGCTMLPATPLGMRRLFKALAAGRLLLILPDQEPVRSSGVFAPFFGVPALTTTLVRRLLRRFGAPALFAYALRTPEGRFSIFFREAPPGLDDPDPVAAASRLNQGVESCVLACPEQYMWAYKRFKTRPPEEDEALRQRSDLSAVHLYRDHRKTAAWREGAARTDS